MIEVIETVAKHDGITRNVKVIPVGLAGLSQDEVLLYPGQALAVVQLDAKEPKVTEPDPKLLLSMARRYRHDFDLDRPQGATISCGTTPAEREAILRTMRQLWEEVTGNGFYRPGA